MLNENDDEQTHGTSAISKYSDLLEKLNYVSKNGDDSSKSQADSAIKFISSGQYDSVDDDFRNEAVAKIDGMYSATKERLDDFSPDERTARADARTKASDDIRAKMQFVIDQNGDDEQLSGETQRAKNALRYLDTHSMDDFTDADVKKSVEEANALYDTAEKRRGHWQVFTDALKRGWQSAGRMAIEGGLMLKPGELTDEDRATIRALKTAGEQYDIAHPKRTGDIREIGSAGDVIDYVAELAGENAVRTGAAVGIGTIGAIAAPAVGATAAVGGVVGGALGGLAFNTGEAVEDQTDENLDVSRALALAQGVGYSALDTIGVVPVVGKLFGKAVAQAGKKAVGTALTQGLREVGKTAVVKGAAKELAKTAVEEAVGEAAQSQVVGRGRRYLQTGSALKEGETPGEAFWEGVNEFVGGLVMGATLGGGPIAANTAGARRKVGIARSIAGKMGADEAFQSLSPEYQMLVGRHLMNESLLATERYASVLSDEERSFLAAQNADIEKDLQEDENAGAARAVLDGMTTAYKLESKEAVVEAARANGEASNIDFQAIRDTEHEIESQDGKRVLAYYDKGTKQHLYRVVNGQDVGKDVWLLTPPQGVKASIDGETAFGDLPSALKAMEDNDIYNRYVAKNSGSKRSVIKQMVEKMYNGEVNLEIADGALALNERMRGQYMQSGGFAAAYDPDTNTLHVLTDKIKSLGQLYTVIAHEGMHKEIADYIKDSGRDKVDGGDLKAGRKRLFSGQENGGFGERFGVEADEAGEEVIVERASVEKIVNALQSQDRTLVGEGVSRVVDAVRRMIGEHTGFTANAITDADVREELSFLLDRGDFGIKATVNGGNEVASESAVVRGERELADQESQERFNAQSAEKQARRAKIAAKSAEIKGNIARKEAEMADLREKTDYQSVLDRDEMVEEELPSGPFSEEDKLIELWPKSYAKFLSDLKLKDDKNSRKRFFDTVQGGDRTVLVDEGAPSESDENGATGVPSEKGTTSRPEAAKPVDKPNPSPAKPSRYGNEKQTAFFKDWMDKKPEGTTLIGTKLNEKGALVIRSTDADGKTTDTYVSKDGVSFVEPAKVVNKQGKVLAGTAAQHAIDTEEEGKARRKFAEDSPEMAEFNHFANRGGRFLNIPPSRSVRNANGKGFHKEFYGDPAAEAINHILDGYKGKKREEMENVLFGRTNRISAATHGNDALLDGFISETGGDPKTDSRTNDYEGFIRRFLEQYGAYEEFKANGQKTKAEVAAEEEVAEAKLREIKIGGDSYDIENLAEEGISRELYDTALAEVEQNGEAVQMFGRGELKKLNGGDIIRFDHADSDWIVESYDDAAGEIVVTANDIADNPLFTDEEKKELTGRRFRITERGWVELKTKETKNGTESKTGKGTDETVAGNAQGERKAGGEDLKLESASQKELNDEQKRNAQRKAVAEKQSAPLKGGTGEVGQTLMDLGGAEGEDLFNRTQKSEQKPGVSKTETTTSTAEKRSEVPTVEEAKAAAKVLGMDAYIPDESLKRKIAGWTRGADKSPLWKAKVDAAKVILADRAAKGKADAKSTESVIKNTESVSKKTESVSKKRENVSSDTENVSPKGEKLQKSEKTSTAKIIPSENTTPTDEGFAAWAVDRDGNPLEFATEEDRKTSRSLFDYMVKQRLVDGKTGKSNVRFKRVGEIGASRLERAKTPPWETEDVELEDQIIRFKRRADGSLDYEGEFNARFKRTISTAGKYAGDLRKLAHGMKRGDMKSLLVGADMMSPLIPQDAVIVPMPNHEGKPIRTMLLGYCISGVRDDVDVVPALLANPHEGSYHDKKIHKRPNVTMHRDKSVTIPEGRPVVVIDNVIASGATWAAAQKVLPDADLVTLADARRKAAQDLYKGDPDFVFSKGEWEYAPKWTATRMKRTQQNVSISDRDFSRLAERVNFIYSQYQRFGSDVTVPIGVGIDGKWFYIVDLMNDGDFTIRSRVKIDEENGKIIADVTDKFKNEIAAAAGRTRYRLEKLWSELGLDDSDYIAVGNGEAAGSVSGVGAEVPEASRQVSDAEPVRRGNGEDAGTVPSPRLKRVTPEEDAAYMDAVRRGDTATATRMVREAAGIGDIADAKTGTPITLAGFHGTPKGGHTVFNGKQNGSSSYGVEGATFVSTSRDVADTYSNAYQSNTSLDPKIRENFPSANEWLKNHGAKVFARRFDKSKKDWVIVPAESVKAGSKGWEYDVRTENGTFISNSVGATPEDAMNRAIRQVAYTMGKNGDSMTYSLFVMMNNPLVVDFNSKNWRGEGYGNDIPSITRKAKSDGYDGVVFKNVKDSANYLSDDAVADTIAVFNPSQIKSADSVTYDDAGNVIPLSQRFNAENNDIRFRRLTPIPTATADDANVVFGTKEWMLKHLAYAADLGRKDNVETMRAGAERARDTVYVNSLMDRIARGDALNSVEMATLIHVFADHVSGLVGLRNGMDAANGADRAVEEELRDNASDKIVTGIMRLAGSRAGSALQILKMGIAMSGVKDTYAYLESEMKAIKAKQGLDPTLTDAERKKLESDVAKLKEINDKITAELDKSKVTIADLEKMNRQLLGFKDMATRRISKADKERYGVSDTLVVNVVMDRLTKRFAKREGARLARSGESPSVSSAVLDDELRETFSALIGSLSGSVENARRLIAENMDESAMSAFNAYLAEQSGKSETEKSVEIGTATQKAKSSVTPLERARKRLDRRRNDTIRALDEADTDVEKRRNAVGRYIREYIKYIAEVDPSLSVKELMERAAEEANAIDPDGKHDALEALAMWQKRKGYDAQTREATSKRMGELMRALELARQGKMEDAARVAGIPYTGTTDRLEKMERELKRMLRQKDDQLMDLLAENRPDTEGLRAEVNRLKAEIAETAEMIRTMRKEISAAEKQQKMVEMLNKRLEEKRKELADLGDKKPDPAAKERLDAEIDDLKRTVKSVSREVNLQNRLNNEIADLERRIRENDFETAPVRPRTERSPEVNALMARRDALRRQLQHQRKMYQYKKLPWPVQVGKDFLTILGESKAIVGSLDLSSMFRQGGQLTFAHPLLFVKNFKKTIEAFKSDDAAMKMMSNILSRPNAKYYKDAGIDFTDWGDGAMSADDRFALYNNAGEGRKLLDFYHKVVKNRFVKAGVNASERAFAMYLNLMRADAFDYLASHSPAGSAANMTKSQLKALGNFLNVASQRGSIEKGSNLGKAINWMNYVLWSPRNLISRFQFLWNTGKLVVPGLDPYGDKTLRGLFAKELVRYIAGVAATITVAKLMSELLKGDDEPPDEIEFDPRSSQFLRVKFGNTRVEFLSGLSQVITFMSRARYTKNSRGQIRKSNLEETVGRFLRTKFSPAASYIYDLWKGETFNRQELVLSNPLKSDKNEEGYVRHFAETFVPLTLTDLIEQGKYSGLGNTAVTAFLTILGAGVNAYDPLTYKQMTGDFHYYKRLFVESPEDERNRLLIYHPMLTRAGQIEAHIKNVNKLRSSIKNIENAAKGRELTKSEKEKIDYLEDQVERWKKIVINDISGAKNPSQVD